METRQAPPPPHRRDFIGLRTSPVQHALHRFDSEGASIMPEQGSLAGLQWQLSTSLPTSRRVRA